MRHLTAAWARVAMPRGPLPDVTIEFVARDQGYDDAIIARKGTEIVGFLSVIQFGSGGQEIGMVWVKQSLRRRGLATALLRAAQKRWPAIRHSYNRSNAADSWSETTGFPRDERRTRPQPGNARHLNEVGKDNANLIAEMIRHDLWVPEPV